MEENVFVENLWLFSRSVSAVSSPVRSPSSNRADVKYCPDSYSRIIRRWFGKPVYRRKDSLDTRRRGIAWYLLGIDDATHVGEDRLRNASSGKSFESSLIYSAHWAKRPLNLSMPTKPEHAECCFGCSFEYGNDSSVHLTKDNTNTYAHAHSPPRLKVVVPHFA